MPSVLHVYKTYLPDTVGGIEESIRQICLATKKFGWDSRIFVLSKSPFPSVISRPEGLVHRSRSWISPAHCDLGGLDAFVTFGKLARQSDVINFHFPWPFLDLLHLSFRYTCPVIITYHSDIVRQRFLKRVYNPLMKRTLGAAQKVVATSPSYAQSSRDLCDYVPAKNLRIIPNGICDTAHISNGVQEGLHDFPNLAVGGYFLFIGAFRYYKGLKTLLMASTLIDQKIVLAGFEPEQAVVFADAKNLRLSNVIFVGRVTDRQKRTLLENCLALVLPSDLRSEAFGMVLVEAAMFGKPMISCEIQTGTSYVNIDKETGFVVSPADPVQLASAMRRLAGNPLLASTLGRNARIRYERYFSGDVVGKAYADLYTEVGEDRGSKFED